MTHECDDLTNMPITRGSQEEFLFQFQDESWATMDLNGKQIELLIWECWSIDWNDWGVGMVIYESITPSASTQSVLFTLSIAQTQLLTKDLYQYRFKITNPSQEAQYLPLYNVVVNV